MELNRQQFLDQGDAEIQAAVSAVVQTLLSTKEQLVLQSLERALQAIELHRVSCKYANDAFGWDLGNDDIVTALRTRLAILAAIKDWQDKP